MEICKLQENMAFYNYYTKDEMLRLGWKKGDHLKKTIENGRMIIEKVE